MKKELLETLDIDLPLANRTQANLWKSRFFEMWKEVEKANKGIRRLVKRNKYLKSNLKRDTKDIYRKLHPGGCKVYSQWEKCECFLCQVDRL